MKNKKVKKQSNSISSSSSQNLANVSSTRLKIERVKVSIRIRPFNEEEKKRDSSSPLENVDTKNNILTIKREYDKKNYSYDKIFPMTTDQISIFESTSKEVVKSVLAGYNGTIFAYGQTGSGKTYTMVGNFDNKETKGIIPRSFDYIFNEIKKDKEHKYNVKISFIQIYLETIQDLLEPNNKEIRIREDPEHGVYLEGVLWIKVNSTDECSQVFKNGEKNRVTESTMMNAYSSRSHAILIAKIEKNIVLSKEKIAELSKESNEKIKAERVMTNSHLYLVDLAGSERVKKSKAVDMRLEEAKKINYSLLILGNCIQSLTETKPTYIAYRDSKLTRLLQESLGGNAKTSLIVTISPSGYNTDETISSLNFGLRAMKVQNKPIINKSVDYQALCIKLQEDLDKLNDEYTELKIKYDKLEEKYEKIKNGEMLIEIQKKNIKDNLIVDSNGKNIININNSSINMSKSSTNELSLKMNGNLEIEIKKLEEYYKNLMKNKNEEYENIIKDVDNILLEKENKIEELINKNKEYKKQIEKNKDNMNDLQKEKQDLMNSISDLTNRLNYEKESKENKSEEKHKKELDQLYSQIEILENKIIPLENMNNLNSDSIVSIKNKINQQINKLKEEKNQLIKEKSDNTVKISQNDIKIKLFAEEINNIDNKLKGNTKLNKAEEEKINIIKNKKEETENEINIKKEENNKIREAQNYLIEKIKNIEIEINQYKEFMNRIELTKKEDVSKYDKTELICENELNKIKMNILKKRYEECNNKIKKNLSEYWELNKNYESLNKHNKNLKKEINSLTNKIIYLKSKEEEIASRLAKEKMKNIIEENQKEKECLINKNKTLLKENEEWKEKINKAESEKEKEIKIKEDEISKLKNEIVNSNKSLNEKNESKIKELSEEINNKEKINLKKTKELEEEIKKLKIQIKSENNEKQKLKKEVNNIKKNLNEKENELKEKINNYEEQLKQLNIEISNKDKEKSEFEKNNNIKLEVK